MSSHHFVKEDQEPALIIADVRSVDTSQLQQLLEWNPTVITNFKNIEAIAGQGFKIDILVGDMEAAEVDLPQGHIERLATKEPFLDAALNYLVKKGCGAANILSDTLPSPSMLLRYAKAVQIVVLGNGMRVSVVKSGFRKWKPKDEQVRIYAIDQVRRVFGLIHQGSGRYLTEKDDFYEVHFTIPYGLVGERL